ncbi:MAG: acyltransferase [Tannerellaceae bacterium]|jgi:predicted LPLAT superfamily acyltransferase|nr:acyltransferase [Tannerellaceae bacterium]
MTQTNKNGWKGRTRGGVFGYRFFILLIKWVGIRAAYLFLALVVAYFIPFAPKATGAAWRYARGILHYGRLRSVCFLLLNYYRFGQTLIDKVAIRSGRIDAYQFRFGEHYADFLDLLNGTTGVVLIGAHVGNWETGAPFLDEHGKKMHIVMLDAEYRKIKELLSKHTGTPDYTVISVNDDSLTSLFKISHALNKKEYVCFQGDRFMEGSQQLRTAFMGREAGFPAGPYLIASRLGVPVAFYFAMREKGMRYSFHFVLAHPAAKGEGKRPELSLLGQYVAALESIIKKYPEQWFNYYDFWT